MPSLDRQKAAKWPFLDLTILGAGAIGLDRESSMKKVLNVGGNSKDIPLPPFYSGWEHVMLDIDPSTNADVICDARELQSRPSGEFDSIHCSHNLEHYFAHDVRRVLAGFRHVLTPEGFAFLRVPDIAQVARTMASRNLDIDDVLYMSPAGPILVKDVLYGWGAKIEASGVDFFAHKTGFTPKSLATALTVAGFSSVYVGTSEFEVQAFAFNQPPNSETRQLLGLPAVG